MLFFVKYAPKKLDDLYGNEDARMQVRRWILNWQRGKKQRPLLVHGPVGTGKTSVAFALQKEYDLDLIQMSASDLRNKEHIDRVFSNALTAGSLSGKQKLLLIDDVDALQKADAGGSGAISKLLRTNSFPILLTAIDIWDKKLTGIRTECELVSFKKVSKPSIAKILYKIDEEEGLDSSENLLASIADGANGDVRSAINDLQARSLGSRDREKDIFDRVRSIFKATTYADAKKATQGDLDYNLLKLWIDENIPLEYELPEDLSRAYEVISKADIFEGRIKNNYWGYLKYVIDLVSVGVALSKSRPYPKFVKYQFPTFLKEMGATVARRAMLKEIGKKIGSKVHANRRDALQYLHLIRHWSEKDQNAVVGLYDFTEEELAFILDTTVEEIKRNSKKSLKTPDLQEEEEQKRTAPQAKLKSVEKKEEPKKDKKAKGSGTLLEFI